ncbi:MAG: cAMP/cGMP-dependent 3',5'-cyclic-AMP/GMP phosphodiesterase [Candidatus Riflebacteria bacterium]|nr:cAMP/cGMP-dependent 3',5'-cyclic-AMP/GMP phosphodiesterase [Candidatus Riflebacteria bacterium]
MEIEVFQLPRGGTLIKTPEGNLQVGATPETIKDTLSLIGEVPETIILPNRLFSSERGVSLADVEFPAYYNFFVKKRPLRIIGQPHQLETILNVLHEALFGPREYQLAREYPFGISRELIPDILAETHYLAPKDKNGDVLSLSSIATAIPWANSNRMPFGKLTLERSPRGSLRIYEGDSLLSEIPLDVTFGGNRIFQEKKVPFEPPIFGITIIGSGHGFDPKEMTSGFIIWVNKKGILIDPPVDSTLWLKAMDINPRLIEDCILTHCHADHDSGILQKLLEEKKIHLYTTETIMESFVRKYQALTGLSHQSFMNLFHFHPVTLQVTSRINGAEFRFFYTLHSIPTIGFEVYYQGKSLVYSSDSLYDPVTARKLYDQSIVNRYRMIELINFPWHHTVILHEAGIPPIHTPIKHLAELPEPVKERLYLIHVSERDIPANSHLKKAPAGPDSTISIAVSPPASNEAMEYLDVLNHIDLFSDLPIEKAREFLTLVKPQEIKKGEIFIKKDTIGDRFYMVVKGRATVIREDAVIKTYSDNDYIGETSMILNAPRNADVVAETDLTVLVMDKYDFLYFIRGTEIARQMKVIAENREYNTWALFNETPVLKALTPTQRTHLQGIMTRIEIPKGKEFVREGSERSAFYLLDSGTVILSKHGRTLAKGIRGSFFIKIFSHASRGKNRFALSAVSDCVAYSIDVMDMYHFLERNPGVFLNLRETKIKNLIVQSLMEKTDD